MGPAWALKVLSVGPALDQELAEIFQEFFRSAQGRPNNTQETRRGSPRAAHEKHTSA